MKKFLIAFFLFQFIFIRAETPIDEIIVVGSYLQSTESDLSPISIIDKDLIGGFIIKVGDIQFDNSVKSSLNRLRTSLKKENLFI